MTSDLGLYVTFMWRRRSSRFPPLNPDIQAKIDRMFIVNLKGGLTKVKVGSD